MVGIKKLGCLGVLSRKTSKNPKRMNLTRRVSGRTHMVNFVLDVHKSAICEQCIHHSFFFFFFIVYRTAKGLCFSLMNVSDVYVSEKPTRTIRRFPFFKYFPSSTEVIFCFFFFSSNEMNVAQYSLCK